ncbi:MAG: carbonic anhydrase family protein [Rhodospirillaceae bacterium]
MELQRRSLLTGLAVAAMCPICLGRGAVANEVHAKHWTYEGPEGPEHWGELKPEFKSCTIGTQQSPINLAKQIPAKIANLIHDWQVMPLDVVNNGHTIQVNTAPGSTLSEAGGPKYGMVNFHFHDPSEHTLDGKSFPMEVHFVHLNETKTEAMVIGVFIQAGEENAVMKTIWTHMPKEAKGTAKPAGVTVDPKGLLPGSLDRYRYEGSLTTPPCTEFVHWNVLRGTITASEGQIKDFTKLFPNNARPVQPHNRRFLLDSF